MVRTIKQFISANRQENLGGAHRHYCGIETLKIMDEKVAEELAEFQEKQRQRSEEGKIHKVWTLQGVGTESSPIGPKDNVLPFCFTASKPCFRFQKIGHLDIFRGVVFERERTSINRGPIVRKPPLNSRYSKT